LITVKNIYDIHCYGDIDKVESLIVCPHAHRGLDFLDDFPEIKKRLNVDYSIFQKYLTIEHDIGTAPLAKEIARHNFEENSVNTIVFEALVPRAIIDTGRRYPQCLRHIINYNEDLYPERDALLDAHLKYKVRLFKLIKKINKNNGVALDLHTMAPFCPKNSNVNTSEAILVSPDNIEEYTDLYLNSHKEGKKRYIQMLTGIKNSTISADKDLTYNIANNFKKEGYIVNFDTPYVVSPHLMGYKMMLNTNVACLEVPKVLISKQQTSDHDFELDKIEISSDKLSKIAKIISNAICKRIQIDKVK